MFTPNRSRNVGLSGSRRSTPQVSGIRNTRSSMIHRSYNTRSSLNITNSSFLASPTVTSAFASSNHTIESYESSIPVLVTEAISLADDLSDISLSIDENGWSWLVIGLKIFVWSHHNAGVSRIPTCKELSLRGVERNDFYKARLVSLHCNENTGAVSVLAASSHGQLMYWPNILISTATCHESKVPLSGTTCFNMQCVDRYGFLLCTSSGIIYHVFATQNAISCKPISKWEGTLSKIGRRVSSFFFSTSTADNNVIQMTVRSDKRNGEYTILIATHNCIQQWLCAFKSEKAAESAQLVCESELNEILSSKLSIEVHGTIKPGFSVWAMDVKFATRKGLVALLLACSESVDMNSTVRYALVLAEDLSNLDHVNVFMFQHTDSYSVLTESENYPFQLAVEDPFSFSLDHYVMWSCNRVILKSFASVDGNYVEDKVNFSESGNKIFGVGSCAGRLILFSFLSGLLTSSSNFERRIPSMLGESALEASYLSQSASNMSLPVTPTVSQTRMDQLQSSDNSSQRLQAAFLHYCKVNLDQAHSIVAEAFPRGAASESLDNAVASLSGDLVDDYPAQDPRWAESVPQDLTVEAAGSYILLHQLEDKLKAHTLYMKFLTEVGIYGRLSVVGGSRDRMLTRRLLWEHAEKLYASISLLQKHSAHQGVVDAAILRALKHRENVSSKAGLTARDFFYREVTRMDEIFEYLLEEEEFAFTRSSLTSRERITKIAGVNSIFEAILSSVRQYRKNIKFCNSDSEDDIHEFRPWTVGSGRHSIRNILLQQLKLTLERGLPEAEDGQQRTLLCQSYAALTDLLLEGYQEQLLSLSQTDKTLARKSEVQAAYANRRNIVITGLLSVGQHEKATSLAEKFFDFDVLIKICDQSADAEKLKTYMNKFSTEGFMEFLFRWYLDRREYRKLLECCGKSYQNELKAFLQAHPNLAWMEQLKAGDFMEAHTTLRRLAEVEKNSIQKKKAYLSLSKLSAAFSGKEKSVVETQLEAISHEQLLIKYQESLPSAVVESLQEEDIMPVYSPDQLIQHYVGDCNENANESDFKKAFELLNYLSPVAMDDDDDATDSEEWKMRIWCYLILRDSWTDVDTMLDPTDSCSHTMLMKTASLAVQSGLLGDIFPDVDKLLKHEALADLNKNASFRYLMKAIFEWFNRSLESSSQ